MNNNLSWFEILFPPSYSLNSQFSIPSGIERDESFLTYINANLKDLDIESIKNIYHRVYVILKALNQATNEESNSHPIIFQESSCQTDFFECIWTSEELGLLRRESDIIKSENLKLKIHVKELGQEINDKNALYLKCDELISKLKNDLSESVKSNHRLTILGQNLKQQLTQLEQDKFKYQKILKRYSDTIVDLNKQLTVSTSRNGSLEHEIMKLKLDFSLKHQLLENQGIEKLKEISDKQQIQLNAINSLYETTKSQLLVKNDEFANLREAFESMKLHFGNVHNTNENYNILLKNISYY